MTCNFVILHKDREKRREYVYVYLIIRTISGNELIRKTNKAKVIPLTWFFIFESWEIPPPLAHTVKNSAILK